MLICIYDLKYKISKYKTASDLSSHNLGSHAVCAEWDSNLPLTSKIDLQLLFVKA